MINHRGSFASIMKTNHTHASVKRTPLLESQTPRHRTVRTRSLPLRREEASERDSNQPIILTRPARGVVQQTPFRG